jgi:hypothetical protein
LPFGDPLIGAHESCFDTPLERASVDRQAVVQPAQPCPDRGRRCDRFRDPPRLHRGASGNLGRNQPRARVVGPELEDPRNGHPPPRPGQPFRLAAQIDLRCARGNPLGIPDHLALETKRQALELITPHRGYRVGTGKRLDHLGDIHGTNRNPSGNRTAHRMIVPADPRR